MVKHRYPNNRKTAYKHKVGTHVREGRVIGEYDRGEGKKPENQPKQAKSPNNKPGSGKLLVIVYGQGGERVESNYSGDALSAITKAVNAYQGSTISRLNLKRENK